MDKDKLRWSKGELREGWLRQIGWIFGKVPKGGGGGSFSIQKFMLQILGTINKAFWAWNWYKRVISGLRVCFFNNFIEKNQNKTHFEKGSCSHTSLREGSGYQNGWIFGKDPNKHWSSRSFDLLNSMIHWSWWSVDLRWLFENRCYIHP